MGWRVKHLFGRAPAFLLVVVTVLGTGLPVVGAEEPTPNGGAIGDIGLYQG